MTDAEIQEIMDNAARTYVATIRSLIVRNHPDDWDGWTDGVRQGAVLAGAVQTLFTPAAHGEPLQDIEAVFNCLGMAMGAQTIGLPRPLCVELINTFCAAMGHAHARYGADFETMGNA